MPPESIYISTHIHTDGPIPGPHSLLTVAAVAHAPGGATSTFTVNVRELPGATLHPVALRYWRERAEEWLSTRRSSRSPAVAMKALAEWVHTLPGEPVLVTDTTDPDYVFLYWYLQRFTGRWPFARTDVQNRPAGVLAGDRCTVSGCLPLEQVG